MPSLRRRRPTTVSAPGALTAAGQVLSSDQALPLGSPSKRWQASEPLWQFYGSIGELHSSTRYIANGLRRVRLVPGFLGDDDEPGPLWDEDGKLMEGVDERLANASRALLRGLRGRTGGQSRIMARLGAILAVSADAYLLGTDDLAEDGKVIGRSFDVCSPSELRPKSTPSREGSTWERRRWSGAKPEDIPPGSFVMRIWRDHPQFSANADSTVAAMSDVLEENVMLTREVMAEARSRLLRGWLLIPDTVKVPMTANIPPGVDPVTWMFMQAASEVITDKSSPRAMIPLVSRMRGDDIEKTKLFEFHGPDSTASILKRKETIERIAHGQDLPPEKTLGHQGTTFANAFSIDEDTFRMFFEPTLDEICDPITIQYQWPSLMLMLGLDPRNDSVPPDVSRYVCHYDASELLVHPNREEAAKFGYGTATAPNFLVSGSAWRRHNAFSEADKPDPAEIAERLEQASLLKVRQTVEGLIDPAADEGASSPAPADGIDKGPAGVTASANGSAPTTNGTTPANGHAATNGHGSMLYLRLAAAGEAALERAVVKVGNQLHNKVAAKRDAGLSAAASSAGPRDVARQLGPVAVTKLIGDQFLTGEFDSTARLATLWARDAGRADAAKIGPAMASLLRRKCSERLFGADVELTVVEVEKALR